MAETGEAMMNGTNITGQNFQTDPATNPLTYIECPVGVGTQKTESEGDFFSQERMVSIIAQALADTAPSAIYPEEQAWTRRYHLYQLLDARPELRTANATIAAFYDSTRTANAGKLWEANVALRPAQLSQSLGSLSAQATTLDAINTSVKPESALRNLLQIMTDNATGEQYMMDSVMYRAQQYLQGVGGMEFGELPVPMVRTRKLSEQQYAIVVELAEQCPYEYGPAVYMARALRQRNERLPRMYRNACDDAESGKRIEGGGSISDDSGEPSYRLYPNPNTGEFTLSLTMDDQDVATMIVWNISGQQVHTQQLNNGSNTVNLNVAEGLYLYRVTVNGTTQWTGKVSVSSH